MADIDDARATGRADQVTQERLAILNRAVPQVVTVEVQQVEGEIGEALGPAFGDRRAQRI